MTLRVNLISCNMAIELNISTCGAHVNVKDINSLRCTVNYVIVPVMMLQKFHLQADRVDLCVFEN